MTSDIPVREGFIPFRGFNVWYRVTGAGEQPGRLPLLALHGGPGAAHDYIEDLDAMASTGRRVILYDQLGCGNSDRPHNPSVWTPELFVEEVGVVRDALGLDTIHLWGSSWGGMLAMQYALTQPAGLASLTVAGSPASIPRWMEELARLRKELPDDVQRTLQQHEDAGTTDDPAYEEAAMVFYRRHVCRGDPWPDGLVRSLGPQLGTEVYNTMNGPNEFHVVGTIKDWDIQDRLGEIKVPTLVTGGRYDEVTPTMTGAVHRGIPGSTWVIFEHSAHVAHSEEPERYRQVLGEFLDRVEAERAALTP